MHSTFDRRVYRRKDTIHIVIYTFVHFTICIKDKYFDEVEHLYKGSMSIGEKFPYLRFQLTFSLKERDLKVETHRRGENITNLTTKLCKIFTVLIINT